MASFNDALKESALRPGQPLALDAVLAALSPEDRKSLEAALRENKHNSSQISRALRSMGHQVSAGAINNWLVRNGIV